MQKQMTKVLYLAIKKEYKQSIKGRAPQGPVHLTHLMRLTLDTPSHCLQYHNWNKTPIIINCQCSERASCMKFILIFVERVKNRLYYKHSRKWQEWCVNNGFRTTGKLSLAFVLLSGPSCVLVQQCRTGSFSSLFHSNHLSLLHKLAVYPQDGSCGCGQPWPFDQWCEL